MKEPGVQPERNYEVKEGGTEYKIPLAVISKNGRVEVYEDRLPQHASEVDGLVDEVLDEAEALGGPYPATD